MTDKTGHKMRAITYEMPLNDLVRTCLRLEQLFNALQHTVEERTPSSLTYGLQHLLTILQVTDRTDLRTKLLQQMQLHMDALTPLQSQTKVDKETLNHILKELQEHSDALHQQHGKFGQPLRDHPFIALLQLRTQQPSGIHGLNDPYYQLWTQQAEADRHTMLQTWASTLQPFAAMIKRILQLLRAQPDTETAQTQHGFFQKSLDVKRNLQLIRVTVPNKSLFPEISAGRHRLAIRLMHGDISTKPQPCHDDLPLTISYCSPLLDRHHLAS